MVETKNGKRLEAAGFTVLREVSLKWSGRGKWFEVTTPDGLPAIVGVQNPSCWHCFGESEWTASSSGPEHCHDGGLGDAIGTDSQMKGYKRLVLRAPQTLTAKYDGLYRASSDEYNA